MIIFAINILFLLVYICDASLNIGDEYEKVMGENGEEAAAAIQEIQVAGPAVQATRVVTETRILRTQQFAILDEMNAVGKAW